MTDQPPRHTTICVCCGTEGPAAGRGLIRACYMRHHKKGTLRQFPRKRQPRALQGRMDVCVCCGAEGPIKGRGLIHTCYQRHRWAGTLTQFPPTAISPSESIRRAQEGRRAAYAARLEDYTWLRKQGEPPARAVARIGLRGGRSTVGRYELTLAGAGVRRG
ncbi:hypothetical protein GCM10017673_40100 [Streptosporangium violaceochromogenes]|nr:hypothetical protein GCM10017673_40100 [Streptosporangium violaceochromogenes]